MTGHPAGALPYSGTSACAPSGRCVSRCRPFGLCRAWSRGRQRGSEPLRGVGLLDGWPRVPPWPSRPRRSRGQAGPGPGVAEQAEARSRGQAGPGPGWPSWSSWPSWPSWQQGRDRGGRKVGRTAVLPCCRAAVLPCCRAAVLPELPCCRAAVWPELPELPCCPSCRAARAAACPSCRVPEGARAGRGLQELPLVII